MSQYVVQRISEQFPDQILETHAFRGDDTVVIKRDKLLEVLRFLKEDAGLAFDLPVDLTVVDWWRKKEPRFEVVYHLYSIGRGHRIRLKVPVDEDDAVVPSSREIWAGFDWYEREAWDLYGVRFEGHPNHTRILLWEGFEGHPLRKDYPITRRQPLTALLDGKQE
jgi:NADH-quinone oxidoreductase subunit C